MTGQDMVLDGAAQHLVRLAVVAAIESSQSIPLRSLELIIVPDVVMLALELSTGVPTPPDTVVVAAADGRYAGVFLLPESMR